MLRALGWLWLADGIVLVGGGLRHRHQVLFQPASAHQGGYVAVVLYEVEPDRHEAERREPKHDGAARLAGFELQTAFRRERPSARGEDLHVAPVAKTFDAEIERDVFERQQRGDPPGDRFRGGES